MKRGVNFKKATADGNRTVGGTEAVILKAQERRKKGIMLGKVLKHGGNCQCHQARGFASTSATQ